MELYWLEQAECDVPDGDGWLCADEIAVLERMPVPRRRADWRLGRWSAKRALAAYFKLFSDFHAFRELCLLPEPGGAPEAFVGNRPAGVSVSISHRGGLALCTVMPCKAALGCDLELVEPHSAAFLADFFTREEQALVARAPAADRARLVALLWSGKESALKALRAGLRLDTRCVNVSPVGALPGAQPEAPGSAGWLPLHVRYTPGRSFYGWWQHERGVLRTVVADPPPLPPRHIELSPVSVPDR